MTVPVSQIVKIVPSSIAPSPGVGFMNGLILTQNTVVPAGSYKEYVDAKSVAKDFTATSVEAKMADAYFGGYVGSLQTPAKLYFWGVEKPSVQADASGASPAKSPTGATISGDIATLLNSVTDGLQDFAGFTTAWELSLAEKKGVAEWLATMDDSYWAVIWDTDQNALKTEEDNSSFGAWLAQQNLDGVTAIWNDPNVAAFCLGWMACLNWAQTNGRATLSARSSKTITQEDGSLSDYTALEQNGYNGYFAFANRTARWNLLRNGSVSGQFAWADSYVCQIWLNAMLQNALVTLITQVGQIPYNTDGDGLMSAAIQDVVNQAKNFGAINTGVTISDSEASALQRLFGRDISNDLKNAGFYFQPNASTAPADVRAARTSPPALFAYCDGGSVQMINLPSIEVQ